MFSYPSPEVLVPAEHPLRAIRTLVNAALDRLSVEVDKIHSPFGRNSIAREKLLQQRDLPTVETPARFTLVGQ